MWRVGELKNGGGSVSVHVFGDAYDAYGASVEAGHIVAVFDAKFYKSMSVSVETTAQVLRIGRAVDYGVCKATKNDGTKCTKAVNVAECLFCEFHVPRAIVFGGFAPFQPPPFTVGFAAPSAALGTYPNVDLIIPIARALDAGAPVMTPPPGRFMCDSLPIFIVDAPRALILRAKSPVVVAAADALRFPAADVICLDASAKALIALGT